MSRFKVGQTVYMDRGDKMRTLVVARVIDNPMIPLYQYSFEEPYNGYACGEQSIRDSIDGRDLRISECFKLRKGRNIFTREEGLEIQRQNLKNWKSKLKEEVYKKLEEYVAKENLLLTDNNGMKVLRGNSLDVFVHNIKID